MADQQKEIRELKAVTFNLRERLVQAEQSVGRLKQANQVLERRLTNTENEAETIRRSISLIKNTVRQISRGEFGNE